MTSRRERQQIPRILAGKMLSELRIQEPDEIDVEAIAAHYNCFVRDGGVHGADGRVYSDGTRGVIRIRSDIADIPRRRYIVAHELGHVRLKHKRTLAICSDADLVRYDGVDVEPEANAFAAELLMPGKLFKPRIARRTPTLTLVRDLANVFSTTFTATAIRLVDVVDVPCAVVWSEAGHVKWSVTSDNCPWYVERGRTLSQDTYARDAFEHHALPLGAERVPGEAWAHGREVPDELFEETCWFSRFGAAFTLLREP